MGENKQLISILAENLDKAQIEYMIIGGQAVLVYGEPRLTKDIDVTVGVDPHEKEKIIDLAKSMKLTPLVKNPQEFIDETFVLPCESKEYKFRVDFIFSNSEFEKGALKRVNEISVDGYKVKFASLEDIIIHKIIAGRPRDIEDVKSIILKNKKIDMDYINNALKTFEALLSLDFHSVLKNILLKNK